MKKNIYLKPSIEMIELHTEGVIAVSGLTNTITNPGINNSSNGSSSSSTIGTISKQDVHPWSGKYSN